MTGAAGSPADAAIAGVVPGRVVRPAGRQELARELREAAESGHTVVPRGAGTRMGLGAPPARVDRVVLTTGLDRVVAWEPGDLTVTVESGVRLADLAALLAGRNQILPLQSDRAAGTVGGLLAAGEDGCLALGAGRIRDFLIGASVALADGTIAKGRGAVVKNVAGYDVPRLLVGSLGTLGVIVEASFKLLPIPEARATVLARFASLAAAFARAREVLDGLVEPVFVNVLSEDPDGDGHEATLAVGLQGSGERVRLQSQAVRERLAGSGALNASVAEREDDLGLRRQLDDPAAAAAERAAARTARDPAGAAPEPPLTVKCLSLPSQQPALAERVIALTRRHGGAARLDGRPDLGVLYASLEPGPESTPTPSRLAGLAEAVLTEARAEGRYAVVVSAPAMLRSRLDVWGPPPPDFPVMERLRKALDPAGLFASGRFVGGL